MQVNISYIECLGKGELDSTTHSPPRKDSDQIPLDPTVKLQIVVSSSSIESAFLFVIIYISWCLNMRDQTRMPWKVAIFWSDTKSWIATQSPSWTTALGGGKPTKIVIDHIVSFASWWLNQAT